VFVIVANVTSEVRIPNSGKLYRSENAGKTWELQNDKMPNLKSDIKSVFLEQEVTSQ
jgi:hypothetical protein